MRRLRGLHPGSPGPHQEAAALTTVLDQVVRWSEARATVQNGMVFQAAAVAVSANPAGCRRPLGGVEHRGGPPRQVGGKRLLLEGLRA